MNIDKGIVLNEIMLHRESIINQLRAITKDLDLAEEIFQQASLKMIDALNRGLYVEMGTAAGWALTVSRRVLLDHYRKISRKRKRLSLQEYGPEPCQEQIVIRHESVEQLEAAIELLDPDQRDVIVLHYYGKLKFKDIATMKSISINTALGQARYAINNLRKLLKITNR